jgi:hypothetical protein
VLVFVSCCPSFARIVACVIAPGVGLAVFCHRARVLRGHFLPVHLVVAILLFREEHTLGVR